MSTWAIGRENINLLVKKWGSQTALAKRLNQKLTQQQISAILKMGTGRHLLPHEARWIENELKIPFGWMSQPWLRDGWPMVEKFHDADAGTRELINDMLKFSGR